MADCAYTTMRAWPWPGEAQLPQTVHDALAALELAGVATDGTVTETSTGTTAWLHDGDDASGRILALENNLASGGIEAYRELIDALHDAGLTVYATNDRGDDYDGEWEYRPAGGDPIARTVTASGETVIAAGELLSHCQTSAPTLKALADVEDAVVGAAAKVLLLGEPVLPKAVIAAI
jgi:hypothetical protein